MKPCFTLLMALITAFLATAQSPGLIDTVEVSSTQIPLRIQETGRNITVLTPKMIRALPAVSIDEILQLVPGVEVQSRGGFGVQANILMRGSTFTQVLILIDGMRLNDPLTGHFNGYIPVVKEEIARIEVLRGPAAAMYGPDAVGGLINIVTKTFAGTTDQGLSGMAELAYGSNKHVMTEAALIGAKGKWAWSLAAMTNESDGELIPGRELLDGQVLDSFRTFFTMRAVGGSFSVKLNPNLRMMFRSSFDYRDFNARYFYSSLPSDQSTEQIAQSFNVLQLVQTSARRKSDLQLAYKYSTDVFEFNPSFPSTNEHVMHFGNVISNHLWEINDKVLLKGGLQLDYREIASNDRGNHNDWHAGLYGMAMLRPREPWNITLSMRADHDDNYGLEFLPQLNLSYVLGNTVIRGAAGRSIRAADYTERFVSNNLPKLTPGRSLGNPDLLAEVSWSQELGADVQLSDQLLLKATGFLRQSDRLIDYVLTPAAQIGEVGDLQSDADYLFARNIANVNTRGLEFEAHYSQKFAEDNELIMVAGYTFINTGNEEDVISVYIANHARHLATFSTIWKLNRFNFNVSGLYKARNERFASAINSTLDPEYMIWNSRCTYQFTDKLSISAQVQNIFDVYYENILGAPMPRRWLIGSLGIRF